MSISEEQEQNSLKQAEEKFKAEMFKYIEELLQSNHELKKITEEKIKQYTKIDLDLPNIGITYNNKLIEISNIFKAKEISMFVKEIDNPIFKYETSFVGMSIIYYLMEYLNRATQILEEVNEKAKEIFEQKALEIQKYKKLGKFGKFLFQIRAAIFPKTAEKIIITETDKQKIKNLTEEYEKEDKNLFKYNLEENLVDTLISKLLKNNYPKEIIEGILEEEIIPELENLGFKNLIPQLEEKLNKLGKEHYIDIKEILHVNPENTRLNQIPVEKTIKQIGLTKERE